MTKRQALDADVPRLIRIYRRSNRASRQPGQQNCVLEKKEKNPHEAEGTERGI